MAAAAVFMIAAGNSWHLWRSVESIEPGSWWSHHHRDRMQFWLAWSGVAGLAAGVVWASRRWGLRAASEPDPVSTQNAPLAGGASAVGSVVVVDVPSTTRLDWKVPTSPRPVHWTDRLRWALSVGWVALLLVGVFAGTRVSTFDDALAAVSSGAVREVTVAAGPENPGAEWSGYLTQEVSWREGWFRHRAEVTWSNSPSGTDANTDGLSTSETNGVPVLGRDVADVLRDARPALVVHRTDVGSLSSTTFLGWYLPAPQVLGPLMLAGALLLLFLILNVPPTWRLTRWAWFWVGFTPVGAILFALFAGPTPGLPRPRYPTERFGGLVGFVASLLAGGLLHWGSR
ncbi:hypothetical protein SAMN06264364_12810 [Quadrisphaera granulorum]|uniref:Uncharacterized protein n=1 Tax=Quadrisphaera granulorum TaxID=317664 RepID=A0A315ZVB1_9ACTN|nr:hypothetical protein BXY45_12810 [Quadrisphaera granulorum]SZE98290.1 hypothetical protein SAMN06264364_12810 [Quadrisphaera granulorum]